MSRDIPFSTVYLRGGAKIEVRGTHDAIRKTVDEALRGEGNATGRVAVWSAVGEKGTITASEIVAVVGQS